MALYHKPLGYKARENQANFSKQGIWGVRRQTSISPSFYNKAHRVKGVMTKDYTLEFK